MRQKGEAMLRGGFTGTQKGMTAPQVDAVTRKLSELRPDEVHHGQCVGADAQFHDLCLSCRVPVVFVHPPDNPAKMANCATNGITRVVFLFPRPYLVRNQDIVDACDFLIACPGEDREVLRSGTWSTIRRAKKANLLTYVFAPDGSQISW